MGVEGVGPPKPIGFYGPKPPTKVEVEAAVTY